MRKQGVPKSRWMIADDNFRSQIDHLMGVMRTKDKRKVAEEAGLSEYKMYAYYETPSRLTKLAERQIESVFQRYGIPYNWNWEEIRI